MHGLPDNLHIYDDLIPYLVEEGRRVVAFDFLGFGASDKPLGATYSFKQQLGDLEAVVGTLNLGKVIPVAHDSSGPASLNYAIEHPDRIESVCMLNSAYAEPATVHWPELIELFGTPSLKALAASVLQSPAQFGWLLEWQNRQFQAPLPDDQKERLASFLGPLIADNFARPPSSGVAFAQMTAQLFHEVARNASRLHELEALEVPIKLIWGENDPYITVAMAEERRTHLTQGSLAILSAGHWLQIDVPESVAKEMLS
jgi:pimeloyl-ACP methyl ester carboxylesterase